MSWGPYTHAQEPIVEQQIDAMCAAVRQVVLAHVPEREIRALVLIGGYGRGEGGVEVTASGVRAHNNLDFLLITDRNEPLEQAASRREKIDADLERVRQECGMGVDFSSISKGRLTRSPSLVMWYDMRYGHKTIVGDSDFLPSLTQFQSHLIPAWNVRDLLVNRGTLLVLNRWFSQQQHHSQDSAADEKLFRMRVRHIVKAVIGFGDALLYCNGKYHWSYVEKLDRMQSCTLADPEFIQLYTDAATFRLRPNYEVLRKRDLAAWQKRILPILSHVHLCCESHRLGRTISDWTDYPAAASWGALGEQWNDPMTWVRKAARFVRDIRQPLTGYGPTQWGLRCAGRRSRFSLAFPAVAYGLTPLYDWTADLLGCDLPVVQDVSNTRADALLDAYVDAWGEVGDTNFAHVQRQFPSPANSNDETVSAECEEALAHSRPHAGASSPEVLKSNAAELAATASGGGS